MLVGYWHKRAISSKEDFEVAVGAFAFVALHPVKSVELLERVRIVLEAFDFQVSFSQWLKSKLVGSARTSSLLVVFWSFSLPIDSLA